MPSLCNHSNEHLLIVSIYTWQRSPSLTSIQTHGNDKLIQYYCVGWRHKLYPCRCPNNTQTRPMPSTPPGQSSTSSTLIQLFQNPMNLRQPRFRKFRRCCNRWKVSNAQPQLCSPCGPCLTPSCSEHTTQRPHPGPNYGITPTEQDTEHWVESVQAYQGRSGTTSVLWCQQVITVDN